MSEEAREGLLGNIPNYFCKNNLKRNPYFVRPRSDINRDIYENLLVANSHRLKGNSVYLSIIPDGAIEFEIASTQLLKYKA
mmetsp:Transcript_8875/g.1270  ORF Transcript_8875/g.1270 Transcript_8875/m.1270 type:complete len:81 (+) Transcript_8875:390-632(+)